MGNILSNERRTAFLVLGLAFLAGGCAVTPRLEVTSTNVFVPERKDTRVALLIPEQTRTLQTARDLPGACLGGIQFMPTPYGETFVKAMRDRFARIFARVDVVPSLQAASGSDATFEATLTDIGHLFGCLIAPDAYAEVKGGLRALDANGREVWRSPTTSYRHRTGLLMASPDLEVGRNISIAIGSLTDTWAQELVRLPAQAYGAPQTPKVVAVAAAPPPAPAVRDAGFPSSPLTVAFARGAPRPDDIAVIVGNADYGKLGKDIPNVKPAYADAKAFKRYVMQALGVREGNIIDLSDATGSQLVRVFGSADNPRGQLYDWVRPGRSKVHVFYAGHGAPGGTDGGAYLVPSDADGNRIELNGYPLEVLYRNLGALSAQSVSVVLEACFSGASQAGTVISNASPVFLKPKLAAVPANVTVIAAGAANQMASWEQDGSHGLFTKYFLTGTSGGADAAPYGNGDGRVALNEFDAYLKDTLTYYARRYYGRDQTAKFVAGK